MFRLRSRLQRRDRESGLVFSWRVPLTSTSSFVVAMMLVALVSAGLAALVRVRVGSQEVRESRSASLILVDAEAGGDWLEALAVEAGPYPYRWNPAADPAYAALRGQALREASALRVPYRPVPVPLKSEIRPPSALELGEVAQFPALPELPEKASIERARETMLGVQVIRSSGGPSLQIPRLPLDAKDAVAATGRRFLIGYQADGRVREVMPLNPDETPTDLSGWLARARVVDQGDKDGWLVVESTVEP